MISNISFAFLFRDIVVSNHARAGKEIKPGHKGSILISLLVTMTILSALGAAMLPLFSSSTMSSTSSNDARKALYMAESGLRYALSELRNSGFSTNAVNELNSTTYSLDDGGTFTINVFGIEFESPSNQTLLAGGTLSLVAPVGKMPEGFSIPVGAFVVNLNAFRDAVIFEGTPEAFTAQVQDFQRVSDTSLTLSLNDPFTVYQDDLVCLAVRPFSSQTGVTVYPGDDLEVDIEAKDFFPKQNGSIYISDTAGRMMHYFYDQRENISSEKVRLTNLSAPTAAGVPSGFPFRVNPGTDYVILSGGNYGVNYRIIPTGSWGADAAVSYAISGETATSASDESLPDPTESSPDFSPQEVVASLSDLEKTSSKEGVIVVDQDSGEIKLGGDVSSAFGAVWFGGTNNIGGIAEFCNEGKCQFNYGVRTFFKLDYAGTGDGFTLAFINGAYNDTASVGGDTGAGELMAYAGNSWTGKYFLDGTGDGLQSPKMALEFDTYTNAGDGPLCSEWTGFFQSDQRNDPLSGGKNVLQYVFWGSKEVIPCRTNAAGDPSPTYDDNRHGAGGELEEWSYTTGDDVNSSPAVGSDGTIYVGSHDDKLHAINSDGSFKWAYTTVGYDVNSSPAVGSDGTIYVGSNDDKLHAINSDGTSKWSYTTLGDVSSSPAIGSDGTIYVGSHDDKLHAINSDGSFKWDYTTVGYDVNSSPAVGSDGTIYVGSNDDKLYAINADGTLKWSYTTGGDVRSSPAIGLDGAIHVGSDDRKVYVLRSDGALRSAFDTEGSVESSPAIATDGTIYVGSKDTNLYAIDPTDNPQNIKDKYCTYEDLIADGVAVDNTTNWLNGAFSKGPWAVRMEVTRSTVEVAGKVRGKYTLKTWIRQCDDLNCDNIDGTYFADTSIEYGAQPPHLEQTIELRADDHTDFNTFLFGLTEATGGAVQTATISNLQLSFIRPGDAVIKSDPNWP